MYAPDPSSAGIRPPVIDQRRTYVAKLPDCVPVPITYSVVDMVVRWVVTGIRLLLAVALDRSDRVRDVRGVCRVVRVLVEI